MKTKLIILCINLFFSQDLLARYNQQEDKVMSICVPKCGTHLLMKCLSLFGIRGLSYDYNNVIKLDPKDLARIRELNKNKPPLHYKGSFDIPTVGPLPQGTINRFELLHTQKLFWNHWPYTQEFESYLRDHTYANFLIIRDPRDMVISFAKMVQTKPTGYETSQDVSLDTIIIDLITGKKEHYLAWGVEIQGAYPVLWDLGLYNFYKLYLPWAHVKNFMVIKFEDLIGPAGAGTIEKQQETITKIAHHIKITLTPEKLQEITKNIFGGTWTFREGKIGSWKKHFTPAIKEIFKQDKQLLQLLIDLGYEKDMSW